MLDAMTAAPTRALGVRPREDHQMSDLSTARQKYVADVDQERSKAHKSSVWLLVIHRVLRTLALAASAATPVLVLLNADKVWTASIAAFAAVALGLIQLTSLGELSLLDRDRADKLRRALHSFITEAGPYARLNDTDHYQRFNAEVEQIRSDWERRREALVRRSFRQNLEKAPESNSQDTS
jgi:hypothetical protein